MIKNNVSKWLNKHPFIDRFSNTIIGAIIGAIIPNLYSIITNATSFKDVFVNYKFWEMMCLFILASMALYFFTKFRVKDSKLADKKEDAKVKIIDKLTNEILGADSFQEAMDMSETVNVFIEEL